MHQGKGLIGNLLLRLSQHLLLLLSIKKYEGWLPPLFKYFLSLKTTNVLQDARELHQCIECQIAQHVGRFDDNGDLNVLNAEIKKKGEKSF